HFAYTTLFRSAMNTGYMRDHIVPFESKAGSGTDVSSKVAGHIANFRRGVFDTAKEVMSNDKTGGVYVNDGIGNRVVVANGRVGGPQSDLVHELSHALEATPQEGKI